MNIPQRRKDFLEAAEKFSSPDTEWNVKLGPTDLKGNIDYFETEFAINQPSKVNVKLSGAQRFNADLVQGKELVLEKEGFEMFRGVVQQAENKTGSESLLQVAGYSKELQGKNDKVFKPKDNATATEIINFLVDGYTVQSTGKTFSTSFELPTTINVDEFRVKETAIKDLNRLTSEYGLEWYVTFDDSNNPVLNIETTLTNTAGDGSPIDTFTTEGPNPNAREIKQNTNKNKGDFKAAVVRGSGDGDDQITASAERAEIVASDKQNDTFTVKEDKTGVINSGDIIKIRKKSGLLGGGKSEKDEFTVASTSFDSNNNETTVSVTGNVEKNTGGAFSLGGSSGTMVYTVDAVGDEKTKIFTDKTIVSQEEAEKTVLRILAERSIAYRDVEVTPSDSYKLYGLGSVFKVVDKDAKVKGIFRVVKTRLKIRFDQNEAESTVHLSNKPASFYDDFSNLSDTTKSQTDFGQGSRNTQTEKENGNATEPEPLKLDFEVPDGVKDVTGKNRITDVNLSYDSAAFKASAEAETTEVSNFNPGTKVVGTSIPPSGVTMEKSNIEEHTHPVGSATATAGSIRQKSVSLDNGPFDVSVNSSSWKSVGTVTTDRPELDISHSFQFEVTEITDANGTPTRDLLIAFVAKDIVANFTINPLNPPAGQTATLTENSTRDFTASFDWALPNGRSVDGSTRDDGGAQIEHTFNEENIASTDVANNQILIANKIDDQTSAGNKLFIPEAAKTFIIQNVSFDSANFETTLTLDDIQEDQTNNTAQFEGEVTVGMVILDSSGNNLDSVGLDIKVAPPLNAQTIHEQNVKKTDISAQETLFEANDTTLAKGSPDNNTTFSMPKGGQTFIPFDGSIDSERSGEIDVDLVFPDRFFDGQNDFFGVFNLIDDDINDFFEPNFEQYDFPEQVELFDNPDFAIEGAGTYNYIIEFTELNTENFLSRKKFGPLFVTLEEAFISQPNTSKTVNDTSLPVKFEYIAGEALSDFKLILDGNVISSSRVKPIDPKSRSFVSSGSSKHLTENENTSWDYGEGTISLEVVNVFESNGTKKADVIVGSNLETVQRFDVIDLGGGDKAHISKISNNTDFDVKGVYFELYQKRDILITGLSTGTHTLEIEAEYNDDNDEINNTALATDSINFTVEENDAPDAKFALDPPEPSVGNPIDFIDNSTDPEGDNTIIAWEWNLGDGTTKFIKDAAVRVEYEGSESQIQEGDILDLFEATNSGGVGDAVKLEEIKLNSHEINISNFAVTETGNTTTVTVNGNELTLGTTFVQADGDEATITVDGTTQVANEGDKVGPNDGVNVEEIRSTGSNGEGIVAFSSKDSRNNILGLTEEAQGLIYVADVPQPDNKSGDITHTYTQENVYDVTLEVYDERGLSNVEQQVVGFGVDGETVRTSSQRGVGGSQGVTTQTVSGDTVKSVSVPNVGEQRAPTNDFYLREQTFIPYQDISSRYEVYVTILDNAVRKIDSLQGDVKVKQLNHTHDVPRRADFSNTLTDVGAGAENKEISFETAVNDEGDVLLDFSSNNESIVLDTTENANDVSITVANEDEDGNLSRQETITANNGTAVTSNSYQDDELFVQIDAASDEKPFEVRDVSGNDGVNLAATATNSRFSSAKEEQTKTTVDKRNGSIEDVATNVSTGLIADANAVANNYDIFLDTEPQDNSTNTSRDITGLLYPGQNNSGRNSDQGKKINRTFDILSSSPNQFVISGDKTSFLKSGDTLRVSGTSSDDGDFTVSGTSFDSAANETTISVNENVSGGSGGEVELRLVNDVGPYQLQLQPDQPTQTKAKVSIEHKKDSK
jgi:hypothetical protein